MSVTVTAPPALPPAPEGTAELFGENWDRAQHYADLLAGEGVVRGVIGPREVDRIWTRHLRNSLAVVPLLPPGSTVIDLGSGAGLPGVPVALARPDLAMTLLEPLARRIRFLDIVKRSLPLDVRLERARAESTEARAAVVVCRAVAPLAALLPLAHRLVAGSGRLVALKGRSAGDEMQQVEAMSRPASPGWLPSHAEIIDVSWPDEAVLVVAEWRKEEG